MKKPIVFFLKQNHCIAVLHIANVWFAPNDVFPAPMYCNKTTKNLVSRKVNIAAKRSHTDRKKYKMLQELLKEEVRKVIEMLEDLAFFQNIGKVLSSWSEKSSTTSIGNNRKRGKSRISQIFSRKLIDKLIEKALSL